ncbi:carbohydrate porin [Vibrio sp. 10N.286.49.F3]|uniref:carbohydrate porin n=1 Tax=unclassified Vibrio TaxID=2614977 RepID=UPI00355020CB
MKRKFLSLSLIAVAVSSICAPAVAKNATRDLDGFKFSGFGRAAVGVTQDQLVSKTAKKAHNGVNIIQTAGNPYKATGKLGNQGSQAELHFDYGVSQNDMNWVVHTNVFTGASTYNDDPTRPASNYFFLDEWWVHGTGIIDSNPNAAVWMGKRYYGRYEASLNGFQHVNQDGLGGGLDNFDVGFGMLNLAVVKDAFGGPTNEFCEVKDIWEQCADDSVEGFSGGNVSFLAKLHSMPITDSLKSDVFFNYGRYFGSDADMKAHISDGNYTRSARENNPDSYQLGLALTQGDRSDWNRLLVRYSNKTSTSMTQSWLHRPSYQVGGFFDGVQEITDSVRLAYMLSHETASYGDDVKDLKVNRALPYEKTTWNQAAVRGTYSWSSKFSTVLELAYDQMDFEVNARGATTGTDGTNSSAKVTLAQDIHLGSGYWDRPFIRLFVTYGQLDTNTLAFQSYGTGSDWQAGYNPYITELGKRDATTFGLMFETWW